MSSVLHVHKLPSDVQKMTMQQCFDFYNEAKMNHDEQRELQYLLFTLEKSFATYEEHLIFDYFAKCEALCIALKDNESYAHLLHLVAAIYFKQYEYDKSIHYLKRCAKISYMKKDYKSTILRYCYIVHCLIKQQEYDQALKYLQTTKWFVKTYDIQNPTIDRYIEYHSISLLNEKRQLKDANAAISTIDFFLTEIDSDIEKALILLLKATIYENEKQYEMAFESLEQAYFQFVSNGDLQMQLEVIERMINCPSHTKTEIIQRQLSLKLNEIVYQIDKKYNELTFRSRIKNFEQSPPFGSIHLEGAKDEENFYKESDILLQDKTNVIVMTYANEKVASKEELYTHLNRVKEYIVNVLSPHSFVCGFYFNQLVFCFNDNYEKKLLTEVMDIIHNFHKKTAHLVYGYACATSHTRSVRELYSIAYAQHYYMKDVILKLL